MAKTATKTAKQKQYFSTSTRHTDADAQRLGGWLHNLAEQGRSSAPEIVDAARPADSPGHSEFEWDDWAAAEKFRETQARQLTAVIQVRYEDRKGEQQSRRAFRVASAPPKPGSSCRPYRSFEQIDQSREDQKRILTDLRNRLLGWMATYRKHALSYPDVAKEMGDVADWIDKNL